MNRRHVMSVSRVCHGKLLIKKSIHRGCIASQLKACDILPWYLSLHSLIINTDHK